MNKIKKVTICFITGMIAPSAVYWTFGLMQWRWNPGDWDPAVQAFGVIMSVAAFGIAFVGTKQLLDDE